MQKEAPSLPRIFAMVVFSLSCFGLLLFLWLSFGGPIPLKPKGYELTARFPEATTLAETADVRIAGVTVGKVTKKELDKGASATTVTLQIERNFTPIPKDTRAILRQKTLLGETYVELTPGNRKAGTLEDGDKLANAQVEPTVELDEILRVFDPQTKQAFRDWVRSGARSIEGRSQDLNSALGNLAGFAEDGAGVLEVLDDQQVALRRVIKNTGVVFGALNERDGQLHDLILNSERTFSATAEQQENLAQVFEIFPTFLDESRLTLARLQDFAGETHPLVNDLKPVADDLGPTVRDLSTVGPSLEDLFRRLRPNIDVSSKDLPQAERFLRGASPLFGALHTFLPELNPILSYANFNQNPIAHFLANGGAATRHNPLPETATSGPRYLLAQASLLDSKSLQIAQEKPEWDRGNAYIAPNNYFRTPMSGVIESFDCRADHPDAPDGVGRTGGQYGREEPVDSGGTELPPCFVQGKSLWDNKYYPNVRKGFAPLVPAPFGLEGTVPTRIP
ncbi:MAG TPA: MlaD family protein [Thermoleophilaceae bacterium]|jgi:virulence factor Mce-like protein